MYLVTTVSVRIVDVQECNQKMLVQRRKYLKLWYGTWHYHRFFIYLSIIQVTSETESVRLGK